MSDLTITRPDCSFYNVLGVKLAAVQIPDVITLIEQWIEEGVRGKYIALANVHMVMEAVHRKEFAEVLAKADLVVPDGMPLLWSAKQQGLSLPRRVYGPDLLIDFCRTTQARQYRHFFYGGAPGVAEKMVENLQNKFDLDCVGILSPPFRNLEDSEEYEIIQKINAAQPDIVWVCLGCPKQERWMHNHARSITAAALIGVGQAFNIAAGTLPQAPAFMREHGLEWLFRLCVEPRRLWRRYLIYNTEFIFCKLLQRFGLRHF